MIRMEWRFVIQLHSTKEGDHYDLMIEAGDTLATWRLQSLPWSLGPGESVLAEALPDHRRDYLTYEGPIIRGRGTVRIVDSGTLAELPGAEGQRRFELRGRCSRGVFTLGRLRSGCWRLTANPPPEAPREA